MNRLALICAALLCAAAVPPAPGSGPTWPPRLRPSSVPSVDPTFTTTPPPPPAAPETFAGGAWIWPAGAAPGASAWFRGDFTLLSAPPTALLAATADASFELYVNGTLVLQTPAGVDPWPWMQAQRAALTSGLAPGANCIAIHATGSAGPSGALASLTSAGQPLCATDATWRATTTDPGAGWTSPGFNDSAWPAAAAVAPVAGAPWNGLLYNWPGIVNDAPYLAHWRLYPQAAPDVEPGGGAITGIGSPPISTFTVTFAPPGGAPPSVVFDFGLEFAGRVLFDTGSPAQVSVGTGESLGEVMNQPFGGERVFTTTPSIPSATPWSGHRYVRLTFLSGSAASTTVHVAGDMKYYPVAYIGSFDCSDPSLTAAWYTGAYTVHLCMQENVWDGIKRDRKVWAGDLHPEAAVIESVFGAPFLVEQTLTQLRADAQGANPPTQLPVKDVNNKPSYSCAWILALADLYRRTGDRAYLLSQHDLLVSLIGLLRTEVDATNRFTNRRRGWSFIDWSLNYYAWSQDINDTTHLYYIAAMQQALWLFREMYDTVNANAIAAWIPQLQAAAQAYLVDPGTSTFGPRRQENAWAVLGGAATPGEQAAIYTDVLKPGTADWSQVATPYFMGYILTALSLCGHTEDALNELRAYYGGMVAEGATTWYEAYDPAWPTTDFHAWLQADETQGYYVSLCHGWSAGATTFLTERVLGVRATSAGSRTVDVVPDLGDLAYATGDVATPQGPIHVSDQPGATTYTVALTLPPGVAASVGLPYAHATVDGVAKQGVVRADGRLYVTVAAMGAHTVVGF